MSYFSVDTYRASDDFGKPIYGWVRASGTPNISGRYVDCTIQIMCLSGYRTNWFWNNGSLLTVNTSVLVNGQSLKFESAANIETAIYTGSHRFYYNDNGDAVDTNVRMYVIANGVYNYTTGSTYNLYLEVNDNLAIPKIAAAYKTPTISVSTPTYCTRHTDLRTLDFAANTSGDPSSTTTYGRVNGINLANSGFGNNAGYFTFTPNLVGVGDGLSYGAFAVRRHDITGAEATAGLTLYTFRKPTIGTNITLNSYSQNATQSNNFTITNVNNRAWTSYEWDFITQLRVINNNTIEGEWKDYGNVTTKSITAQEIRTLIPKQYDNIPAKIQIRRYSPSANWYSDNNAEQNLTVSYRPQKEITENDVSYRLNNNAGLSVDKNSTVVADSSLNGIYISWIYNTSLYEAGYVQGYRIRLYDSKNDLVNTYYSDTNNFMIPKGDIPKMQVTYIDITPYFKNDSNNTDEYWYYLGDIQKMLFIRLYSRLETPTIDYPINNSNWINTKYRICFKLPIDPDNSPELETYQYDNIELEINGTQIIRFKDSFGQSDTSILAPQCFSCNEDLLWYRRPIIINPSILESFIQNTIYTLRIRVKKKYDGNNLLPLWSEWSSITNINISSRDDEFIREEFIMASDLNNCYTYLQRALDTYTVEWINKPPLAESGKTIISRNQFNYNNVYYYISALKDKVNNYGIFDMGKDEIKFDYENNIDFSFTPITEIITATQNKLEPPIEGRNYFKILYENINKLI